MFFLSRGPTKLLVESISLRNVETGYVEEVRRDTTYETRGSLEEHAPQKDDALQVGYLPLFDEDQLDYESFRDAKELELTVTYRQDGGAIRKELFTLRLVKLSGTAWAT